MSDAAVAAEFAARFGASPDVDASAPGRVNLIGEHTDYNGGFVLPAVIPQRTTVTLARRDGRRVRLASDAFDSATVHAYELGSETRRGAWTDYVEGVTGVLREAGYRLGGFDALITSTVPVGSGLSSSAALLVATMRALREAFALDLDDVTLARLAQRAEVEFVGARVGIMAQMAASLGAGGDYNTRRAECERAAALLGVAELRDVPLTALDRVNALPEPLNRRARHVVTENARVLDAVAALKAGDLPALGQLFFASHASMRDDFQISIPPIDLIVELARAEPAVVGARLTGGGFGGSVVMLAHHGQGRPAAKRIARAYSDRTGHHATVLLPS
jgi:galactokinase